MIKEIPLENLINFVPTLDNQYPNSISDTSDTSDQSVSDNKESPISIAKCLRCHSGNVHVQGTITSMSRLYKMVKSVTVWCSSYSSNKKEEYDT